MIPPRQQPDSVTPPTDPMSLQDHVRTVQEMRTSAAPRKRPTSKLVAGGAVIAGIVALWQFGPRFGFGPGGKGAGNGSGTGVATPASDDAAHLAGSLRPSPAPERPLRVTIDGNRYLVNGKEVDLPAITAMAAKLPAAEGPAIEVKRDGSSRVKAEQELKAAIDQQHLAATWTPPLE